MENTGDFVLSGNDYIGLPEVPHEVGLGSMRLCLLPPGQIDIAFEAEWHFVDINLGSAFPDFAVNSDARKPEHHPPNTMAFGHAGSSFSVAVENTLPGCYLELEEPTLRDWCEKADLSLEAHPGFLSYEPDPVAAQLARSALPLLVTDSRRHSTTDRLTFEALGFAIAARALARLERHINPEADATESARLRADARRIALAVDWAEAHICDPMLTVSDMAAAANLSPAHFAKVFKSGVGETAYRYILRRRAEFARDLIIGTAEPFSHIAYTVGFSSQAHMNYVIRRQFGTTPGSLRS